MKVLITGATGQLGGALQRMAPALAEISAIDIEDCDFADIPMLRARLMVEAPDIILNAAAYTAVDKAEDEEDVARAINADAVGAMAETMAQFGGRLVHVSTDLVFDGSATHPYSPGDRRNPLSAYGRTKAEGEDHLSSNDLLVRTAWLYEAGGTNFVRTMIRLMNERDQLAIASDRIGCPTWATGLARTIWGLVAKGATGTFHHCDDGKCSLYDLAAAIAEDAHRLGLVPRVPTIRSISSADDPTLAQRPTYSLLDCAATRLFLSDTPVPWRINLRLMLEKEARLG